MENIGALLLTFLVSILGMFLIVALTSSIKEILNDPKYKNYKTAINILSNVILLIISGITVLSVLTICIHGYMLSLQMLKSMIY